jgi:hypothetical protein
MLALTMSVASVKNSSGGHAYFNGAFFKDVTSLVFIATYCASDY